MTVSIPNYYYTGIKINEYLNGKIKILKYPDGTELENNQEIKNTIQKLMEEWVISLHISYPIDNLFTGTFLAITESAYNDYFIENKSCLDSIVTEYFSSSNMSKNAVFYVVSPFRLSYNLDDLEFGRYSQLPNEAKINETFKKAGNSVFMSLTNNNYAKCLEIHKKMDLFNLVSLEEKAQDYDYNNSIATTRVVNRITIEKRVNNELKFKYVINDPYYKTSLDYINECNWLREDNSSLIIEDCYFNNNHKNGSIISSKELDFYIIPNSLNNLLFIDHKNKNVNVLTNYPQISFNKTTIEVKEEYLPYIQVEITDIKKLQEYDTIVKKYGNTNEFSKQFKQWLGIDTNSILDEFYDVNRIGSGTTNIYTYRLKIGYKEYVPYRKETIIIKEEKIEYSFRNSIKRLKHNAIFKAPNNLNILCSNNRAFSGKNNLYTPLLQKHLIVPYTTDSPQNKFYINKYQIFSDVLLIIDLDKDIKNKNIWFYIFYDDNYLGDNDKMLFNIKHTDYLQYLNTLSAELELKKLKTKGVKTTPIDNVGNTNLIIKSNIIDNGDVNIEEAKKASYLPLYK